MMALPEAVPNDGLLAALKIAAHTTPRWNEAAEALRRRQSEAEDIQAGWLMTAFDYVVIRRNSEKVPVGYAFMEAHSIDGVCYPMPLFHVPAEIRALWSETAERAMSPVYLARLHHLLFELREGNVGDHARRAAAAYLELGTGPWHRLDRITCLYWAGQILHQTKNHNGARQIVPPLLRIAQDSLAETKPEPGVALSALEILTREDPDNDALPALLDQARSTYTAPWLVAKTIEMQKVVWSKNRDCNVQLQRELGQYLFDYAALYQGMMRMVHMETAAQFAKKHGYQDLERQATDAMQAIPSDALGLTRNVISISMDEGIVDAWVKCFTDLASLADAFALLAVQEPPTGDKERNSVAAGDVVEAASFHQTMPKVYLGDDGLARYTAVDEADKEDEQLAAIEMMNLPVAGDITARIMTALLDRFQPTLEDLYQILTVQPHVTESTASTIGKAFLAYSSGRFEEAAGLAMPKIESLVRARLETMGGLHFRVQQDKTRAQYPTLRSLLSDLKPALDPSWHRYFRTFLVSPFGRNYRNELLHGFLEGTTQQDATLLLVAALHLALAPAPTAQHPS